MTRPVSDETTDQGFSLMETLMAMFVFTIFATMVVAIYSSMSNQSVLVNSRFTSTAVSQTVMDRITSELRAATYVGCGSSAQTPIASADGTDITFYAALGGATGPTKVSFQLSGDQLTETDTPADSGGASPCWTFTGTPTVHLVSPSVVNGSSNALFNYYNSAGAALSPPLSTPAQTIPVESVGVNLVVQAGTSSGVSTLDSRIHLLNVDFEAGNG